MIKKKYLSSELKTTLASITYLILRLNCSCVDFIRFIVKLFLLINITIFVLET